MVCLKVQTYSGAIFLVVPHFGALGQISALLFLLGLGAFFSQTKLYRVHAGLTCPHT